MRVSRREFMGKLGWGMIFAAGGSSLYGLARFSDPPIVTPSPGAVEISDPSTYVPGSLTPIEKAKAYLGRDEKGFYAIVAICTHLGCTPRLETDAFACPCHGSRFARDGQVLSGPATRPLDRAFVGQLANGHLYIDRSRKVDAGYRLQV